MKRYSQGSIKKLQVGSAGSKRFSRTHEKWLHKRPSMANPLIIFNCVINILSVDVIVTYPNAAQLPKAL